ncbi:hypothetical protein CPB84DRAFT_1749431 [Gymnopilus junonius]|uniref:BRCT domain-containing protein n=1 Tax=Gymnopilus junonius TaxID=109634 RepID=A0A9P5NHS0_GYMJU|nr:hypothetical protein CPB84DRAFT_1749431 [Gymnopilus junonius]
MALFAPVTYHLSLRSCPPSQRSLTHYCSLMGRDARREAWAIRGLPCWEEVVRQGKPEGEGEGANVGEWGGRRRERLHGRQVAVVTPLWVERSAVLGKLQPRNGVKVLLPHWFDDVVKLGMRGLSEDPYEWPEVRLLKGVDGVGPVDKDRGKDKEVQNEKEKMKRNIFATAHIFAQPMNASTPPSEKDIALVASTYTSTSGGGAGAVSSPLNPKHPPSSPNGNASILSALGVGTAGSSPTANGNGAGTGIQHQIFANRKILLSRTLQLYHSRHQAVRLNIERAGGVVLRYDGDDEEQEQVAFRNGSGNGVAVHEEQGMYERIGRKEKVRRRREAELVGECDVLVTRWRYGRAYVQAVRQAKTIGTLAWLFHVQSTGIFSRPLDQLMHYPVPKRPIEGFDQHVVTVTNYTGEAREYLKKLIMSMGATFTPTPTPVVHTAIFMLHAHVMEALGCIQGTKSSKAISWSIPVVNHTWLEDCFIQWRNLTPANIKYIHFPPGVDFSKLLGERGLHTGGDVAGAGTGAAQEGGVLVNGFKHDVNLGTMVAGAHTREEVMGRIESEAEELAEMGDDLSDIDEDEVEDEAERGTEMQPPNGTEASMKEVAGLVGVDGTIVEGDQVAPMDLDLEKSPVMSFEPPDDLMDFQGFDQDQQSEMEVEGGAEVEVGVQEPIKSPVKAKSKDKSPTKPKSTSTAAPARESPTKPTSSKPKTPLKSTVNDKTASTSKTKTSSASKSKSKAISVSDVSSGEEELRPPHVEEQVIELEDSSDEEEARRVKVKAKEKENSKTTSKMKPKRRSVMEVVIQTSPKGKNKKEKANTSPPASTSKSKSKSKDKPQKHVSPPSQDEDEDEDKQSPSPPIRPVKPKAKVTPKSTSKLDAKAKGKSKADKAKMVSSSEDEEDRNGEVEEEEEDEEDVEPPPPRRKLVRRLQKLPSPTPSPPQEEEEEEEPTPPPPPPPRRKETAKTKKLNMKKKPGNALNQICCADEGKRKSKGKEPELEIHSDGENEEEEDAEEAEQVVKKKVLKKKDQEESAEEDEDEETSLLPKKATAKSSSKPLPQSTSKAKSTSLKSRAGDEAQQAKKGRSKPLRVYDESDEEEEEEEEEENMLPPPADSDDSDELPAAPLQKSKAELRAEENKRKGKEQEKISTSKPKTATSAKGKGKRPATPTDTEPEDQEDEPPRKTKATATATATPSKATPNTLKRVTSVLLPSLELSPEKVKTKTQAKEKEKQAAKGKGKAQAKKVVSEAEDEEEEEPQPPKPAKSRPSKKAKDASTSAPLPKAKSRSKAKVATTAPRHPSSVESEDENEEEEEEVTAIISPRAARTVARTESIRAVAGQVPANAATPSKSTKAKKGVANGAATSTIASTSRAAVASVTATVSVKPKPKPKPKAMSRRDQETPMDVDQSASVSIADDVSISVAPPRRSAAAKATQKLHDTIMPDLLQYEAQRKKAGKSSSSYAFAMDGDSVDAEKRKKRSSQEVEEVEIEKPKKKRRVSGGNSNDEVQVISKPSTTKGKGKQKTVEDDAMEIARRGHAIMTTQVSLRDDVVKALNKLGVKMTTRPSESEKDFILKDKNGENKYGVVLAESLKRSKAWAVPVDAKLLKNVVTACGGQVYTQELVLTGALAQEMQWDREDFLVPN